MSKLNSAFISLMHIANRAMSRTLWMSIVTTLCIFSSTAATAQTTVTYFHNDISGSPMVATNAAGSVVWKASYRPYGDRMPDEFPTTNTTASNKIGYAGSPFDASTGLSYMGARYYDPVIGRFMGIDPVGFQEDNIHSFNRYAYANNNPYKFVDRDGRLPVLAYAAYVVAVRASMWAAQRQAGMVMAAEIGAGVTTGAVVPSVALEGVAANAVTSALKGEVAIIAPYARPTGATTAAQRAAQQGKPCVDCGVTTGRQVADHKEPLVKEYYRTGAIDKERMRSLEAVQPQCPSCSASQGADMSRFSREMKKEHGFE